MKLNQNWNSYGWLSAFLRHHHNVIGEIANPGFATVSWSKTVEEKFRSFGGWCCTLEVNVFAVES